MKIPNTLRDTMMTGFRQRACELAGIVPFEHQAAWWALTDGQVLVEQVVDGYPQVEVRLPDDTVAMRGLVPRATGRARVVAELGAYKCGKSFGSAAWATGFAAIPDARVYLVGLEYDMCVPEFDNLVEFLLSERGLNLPRAEYQNRPKDGRLWLQLENGARFEARSWERSESLKGKEVDAYIFCEAYQLPGIECFMNIKQNLRARNGYAIFPTTPDRPWVSILHENGHDDVNYPDWACQCGVPASVNPFTWSARVQDLDETMMTREKFAIAYLGKIGTYVGRVFAYQRGEQLFTPSSHPHLWHDPNGPAEPRNLKIPPNWTIQVAADTGTFMGAVIMAFDEAGQGYVIDELANYRYVGDVIELEPSMSLTSWADALKRMVAVWGGRPLAWVDTNSQFKQEMWRHHGVNLVGNPIGRVARTEAARAAFQHNRIWLAPWLRLLPYELEHCQWPDEATLGGKFERLKKNDHLVDGVEHLCARRFVGSKAPALAPAGYPTYHERPKPRRYGDPHMGSN